MHSGTYPCCLPHKWFPSVLCAALGRGQIESTGMVGSLQHAGRHCQVCINIFLYEIMVNDRRGICKTGGTQKAFRLIGGERRQTPLSLDKGACALSCPELVGSLGGAFLG